MTAHRFWVPHGLEPPGAPGRDDDPPFDPWQDLPAAEPAPAPDADD